MEWMDGFALLAGWLNGWSGSQDGWHGSPCSLDGWMERTERMVRLDGSADSLAGWMNAMHHTVSLPFSPFPFPLFFISVLVCLLALV